MKLEITLTLLALAGIISFPVALLTGKGEIFIYGYPLSFPFMVYMFRRKKHVT
jgi:hypothetical protein